jgi:hypothetical protein
MTTTVRKRKKPKSKLAAIGRGRDIHHIAGLVARLCPII